MMSRQRQLTRRARSRALRALQVQKDRCESPASTAKLHSQDGVRARPGSPGYETSSVTGLFHRKRRRIRHLVKRFLLAEAALESVEWAIVGTLIVFAATGAFTALGGSSRAAITTIAEAVEAAPEPDHPGRSRGGEAGRSRGRAPGLRPR